MSAVIQDDIATAETQLKLLDSIATTPSGGVSKPAIDATNLASVLTTISASSTSARAKVREAKLRLRDLDKDVAKLNADLQKIATQRKSTYEVRASIEAESPATSTVTIEYAIADAGWHWVYEARLDTSAKRVTLGRQVSVRQGSGENWRNATLTLTTARPAEDAMTPELFSLFVALDEDMDYRAMSVTRAAAPELSEIVVTGSRRRDAELIATDYLAEYRIPGRVTLDADDEPRLYPVAEEAIAVDLVARVVPERQPFRLSRGVVQVRRDCADAGR